MHLPGKHISAAAGKLIKLNIFQVTCYISSYLRIISLNKQHYQKATMSVSTLNSTNVQIKYECFRRCVCVLSGNNQRELMVVFSLFFSPLCVIWASVQAAIWHSNFISAGWIKPQTDACQCLPVFPPQSTDLCFGCELNHRFPEVKFGVGVSHFVSQAASCPSGSALTLSGRAGG